MERFVPHYTCKRKEQTGFVCFKILSDYADGVGVFEKKPKDLSDLADKVNKKLTKLSPWRTPIMYDFASFSKKPVMIVKEEDKYVNKYSKKKSKEVKAEEKISEEIENELMDVLKKTPVMLFLNLNKLYKQRNIGLGWIIITEYNLIRDEFIIYDPMYYTRLPKTKYWERLQNTAKKRFISFNRKYFIEKWAEIKETRLIHREDRKNKGIKLFTREFLAITNPNT
jgi:hypothetical protein